MSRFYLLGGDYQFTIEALIHKTLRLALLLFWRNIANKLSVSSLFKLQLKLNLSYPSRSTYSKETIYHNVNKDIQTIWSIGSVNNYSNQNFKDALDYIVYPLTLIVEEYSEFYVKFHFNLKSLSWRQYSK